MQVRPKVGLPLRKLVGGRLGFVGRFQIIHTGAFLGSASGPNHHVRVKGPGRTWTWQDIGQPATGRAGCWLLISKLVTDVRFFGIRIFFNCVEGDQHMGNRVATYDDGNGNLGLLEINA